MCILTDFRKGGEGGGGRGGGGGGGGDSGQRGNLAAYAPEGHIKSYMTYM